MRVNDNDKMQKITTIRCNDKMHLMVLIIRMRQQEKIN